MNTSDSRPKAIHWHRELPPFDAEPMGEHTIEATSDRIAGTLAHRDELWDRCHEELMTHTRARLEQTAFTSASGNSGWPPIS